MRRGQKKECGKTDGQAPGLSVEERRSCPRVPQEQRNREQQKAEVVRIQVIADQQGKQNRAGEGEIELGLAAS